MIELTEVAANSQHKFATPFASAGTALRREARGTVGDGSRMSVEEVIEEKVA